jgi:hypothetical protein
VDGRAHRVGALAGILDHGVAAIVHDIGLAAEVVGIAVAGEGVGNDPGNDKAWDEAVRRG